MIAVQPQNKKNYVYAKNHPYYRSLLRQQGRQQIADGRHRPLPPNPRLDRLRLSLRHPHRRHHRARPSRRHPRSPLSQSQFPLYRHLLHQWSSADGRTPEDTRTKAQKSALRHLLESLHKSYPKALIVGHSDLDPKKPHCPGFDVVSEYRDLQPPSNPSLKSPRIPPPPNPWASSFISHPLSFSF